MKQTRILAFTLALAFSGVGAANAAMFRQQAEQNPLAMVKSDAPAIATGTLGEEDSAAKADVMKKKKKKTKKTKAS